MRTIIILKGRSALIKFLSLKIQRSSHMDQPAYILGHKYLVISTWSSFKLDTENESKRHRSIPQIVLSLYTFHAGV